MAGSVESSVDRTEVLRGNTVLLTLTVVGEKSEPLPEIDEINGIPVDAVSHHSGSTFIQVNGENRMEHTRTMTLEFKPTHSMTIPSFQIEVDGALKTTSAIALKVVDNLSGNKRNNPHFAMDIKLDKAKVYLGEPLLATVDFEQRTGIDITQLEYKKPEFKDFFNKQLGGEKRYKKDGYTIHEINYLLIAKQEGNFTLGPAQAKVAQRVRQRQAGGWFADVPKWSKVVSDSLNVEVIKPQGSYDLVGDFSVSDTIDTTKTKANKPINLTIKIDGKGSLDDFEGINFDIDGVTIYSDDAKVNSKLIVKRVESHYVKHFVFVADHDFTIPSQTLRIFNYKTGKIQTVKTKTYTIKIKGEKEGEVSAVVHTDKNLKTEKLHVKEHHEKSFSSITLRYGVLAGMFLLGSMVTLLLQYLISLYKRKWKRKKLGFDGHEALRVLYPHIGASNEVETMVRKLYAMKNGEKNIKIDRELLKKMVNKYK